MMIINYIQIYGYFKDSDNKQKPEVSMDELVDKEVVDILPYISWEDTGIEDTKVCFNNVWSVMKGNRQILSFISDHLAAVKLLLVLCSCQIP